LQQIIKEGEFDNLTTLLVNSVTIIGGLSKGNLVAKLVSFGADGVTIGVTMQLIENHAPLVTGIHCIATWHLALQSFSSLPLVAKIEGLLQGMYVYFFHSLEKLLEHVKLGKVL
jgi:hypothetical protein